MDEKKFLIKDFIQYASPCFGCDHLPNFYVGYFKKENGTFQPEGNSRYKPHIMDKYIEVELNVRYRSSLILWIFHKNHKIVVSDEKAFEEYLQNHQLYLVFNCTFCNTQITSSYLDFRLTDKILSPLTVAYERLQTWHDGMRYVITSDFAAGKSHGSISLRNQSAFANFNLPLTPKYKLQNKQKLIDKLNTYQLFS